MIDFAWNVAEGCILGLLAFGGYVGFTVYQLAADATTESAKDK